VTTAGDPGRGQDPAVGVAYGRICLWGDHCDWAQRQVIATSIDRSMRTEARARLDETITIKAENSVHGTTETAEFQLPEAASLPLSKSSLKYVNAVVIAILERYPDARVQGLDLEITSSIPMRKGLSSSAALCVSTARALSKVWGLDLSVDDVIMISYKAERGILGIGCGMMDQTASAHEYPLYMDFSNGFEYEGIDLKRLIPIVVGDVGGQRDTELILNTLNDAYFRKRDPLIVRTLGRDIPSIVKRARVEMEGRCRLEELGRLMDESQRCYDEGLRPFVEEELGSALLYRALEAAKDSGALGAKWTGAGGAGSIIALASDMDSREDLARGMLKSCSDVMVTAVEPRRA